MAGQGMKIYYRQAWLAVFRPLGGGNALTLGSHVFYRGEPPIPASTLAHEGVHVAQWAEMGTARFLAVYLWEWVKLRGKPIWEHPLERPAYEAGGKK